MYPSNAYTYGQHIACFSASTATLDSIAPMYMFAEVQVLLGKGDQSFKNLYKLANYRLGQMSVSQLIMNLRLTMTTTRFYTKRGMLVNMFGKVDSNYVEFYDHIVTPVLQDSMIVETWGNGSQGLDDPVCHAPF